MVSQMGNELHDFLPDGAQEGPQPGPSWQKAKWPILDGAAGDDLTQALDPTAMKIAIKQAAPGAGAKLDERAIEQVGRASCRERV